MQLPPGYQLHPQHPQTHMWNPQNNDVRPIEAAVPVPPTPPPASALAPAPVAAPAQTPQYGSVDLAAVGADTGNVFTRREKKYFIDLPTPTSAVEAEPFDPLRQVRGAPHSSTVCAQPRGSEVVLFHVLRHRGRPAKLPDLCGA